MEGDSPGTWLLWLAAVVALAMAPQRECSGQGTAPVTRQRLASEATAKPSGGLTASIQQGLDKLVQAMTPEPEVIPAEDPISLANEVQPGTDLYVAVARLCEESGKLGEAAGHYQKALQREPDSLAALLGYARLKDRTGDPAAAEQLYLRAAQVHPTEAAVFNNLGLFYAERGAPEKAGSAFVRAIQLQPSNPKYRNNIARVLVRLGRTREAYGELAAVHRPAVAYYNLGYLLEEQGQLEAATQHYAVALQADSTLTPAMQALERLKNVVAHQQPSVMAERPPSVVPRQQPSAAAEQPPSVAPQQRSNMAPKRSAEPVSADPGIRLGSRPARPSGQVPAVGPEPPQIAPLPSAESMPTRLPPVSAGQPAASGTAPLPPRSYHWQPTPDAPLPPGTIPGTADSSL